jgi:hypothetical protein
MHRKALWLITAGWPCQDYSSAGQGKPEKRAALLDDVIRIIRTLEDLQRKFPVAYLLENVAMQHNFRHPHIRNEVYPAVVKRIGEPFSFDAVKAGSYAHRLRNYWTNLCDSRHMAAVMKHLRCPHDYVLQDLVGADYELTPVDSTEKRAPNRPGRPRVTFPTLMSFPFSRAFREGRPGSMLNKKTK